MPSLTSRFPRISSYGFLSDCHSGALVSPDGSVEWLCVPRFDSPSVFGSLLDRSAGFWQLGPPGLEAPVSRRYEPGTNVLETTWMTGSGWIIVRDALTVGDWRTGIDFEEHKRPPSDDEAEHVLVRTVECVQGEVDIEMVCQPAFDYGATRAEWKARGDEGTGAEVTAGDLRLILSGDLGLGIDGPDARARHRMKTGEKRFCALAWGPKPLPPETADECTERIDRTVNFWRRWLETGYFPDHPWRGSLQRSALALKGLTYAPTGAMIAALTTSLPETPGGERNWDYRYCWIRDGTFTLWGLHTLGFDYEATDFMGFLADIYRDGNMEDGLQIMYGIRGERDLTEKTLDHLGGYEGAKPVRIGNGAFSQRQNDVYGALLVYIHTKVQDHFPSRLWDALCTQVEAASAIWDKPDQGIWEARGDPKHYVSSKLMCWVALDRGSRLAHRLDDGSRVERWSKLADEIKADILEKGVSDQGVFRQHYETDALDASTLLVPLVRFLPSDDERVRATVLAIADDLTQEGGLVLRYRVDETDDGLHGAEASFTICSFWLVSALSEIGERERASELCERLLEHAGPLGLYAEELDSNTGRHWGNYPQAFTHLALINAVSHVISDDHSASETPVTGVLSEMVQQQG